MGDGTPYHFYIYIHMLTHIYIYISHTFVPLVQYLYTISNCLSLRMYSKVLVLLDLLLRRMPCPQGELGGKLEGAGFVKRWNLKSHFVRGFL